MDRNRVIRATELTIGFLIILVGAFGLNATMYGMKFFFEHDAVRSVVVPVTSSGITGLVISAIAVGIGIIPFIRKMSFGFIIRLPFTIFKTLKRFRNWFLEKVDYLQSESEKWKRVFQVLKSPYSLLRAMGLSPQMAASLLIGASTVGGGVVVNETILEGQSFSRGDAGVYNAPLDSPVFYESEFNTLRVDLNSTPVGLIEISDTTLGTAYANSTLPSGETNVIIIGGLPTTSDPVFSETYLEIGHLYIDKWRCQTLTIENSKVNKLIVRGNSSDGQSIAATASSGTDVRMRGINGGNRANDMISKFSYFDQLKVTAASSGVNGKIDVLKLSNLYSKGGGCIVSRVLAGTMEITLNEIGNDSDLATKDFQIQDTVLYKSFTNDSNYEIVMATPAVIP